ncbi:MAG: bifunctional proline dehydrogenase/L-glutamate gamma-semialdehyde dehydrogenase PutA, partial [Pseudomonadota bacterium]
ALMCLAEALLRVPDAQTMDALIEDKIAPSDWGTHLGRSSSSLVNASTWALMLTGRALRDGGEGIAARLRGLVRRLGEPVIRTAARRAMREMGNQFVLGETIDQAIDRGRSKAALGYTFSYDMLGEAALTARDAAGFFQAYHHAITRLASFRKSEDIRGNPGISVKFSALHPRYEEPQRRRVLAELVPVVLELARAAKSAGMGFNVDAEEANRLELSLDVIAAVLADPSLAGWDGFGVVVQTYGKRAAAVIDWLYALAEAHDRRIMVRLVKGAYWDTEIKRAQVEGLKGFPVFTGKAATDVSYLCCARQLLRLADRIYPQFATHNAHTVAAILEMGADPVRFEFQRLHGMGEALHDRILAQPGARCRIYAPVGAHRDLLAYLVRRLLENGANGSFVNQIVDTEVTAETIAADPFAAVGSGERHPAVVRPADLFQPRRVNSCGRDLHDPAASADFEAIRAPWRTARWRAAPMGKAGMAGASERKIVNPARPEDVVGHVRLASRAEAEAAITAASPWNASANERAAVLGRAADLYEAHRGEIFALLAREAGKTPQDAVAELREAVDFLRYYAVCALDAPRPPRGRIACISPWNFPLAIFTGQISAALAAGNAVLAKPAEATPLVAARAVALMYEAGVPLSALHLLPGIGAETGVVLSSDPRIDGVAFTGSTITAKSIDRTMAARCAPDAPLIAETGGLNAMIVDSTALPEQAVKDVIVSAFQSAGQRCSALRILYLQRDIAASFLEMLHGAMDQLALGDPWSLATDVGPVIDAPAQAGINAHIARAQAEGRVLKTIVGPKTGHFVAPCVLRVSGIGDLEREIFGPVLHVATYDAGALDQVVDAINATGYGLTFGMHSRIDDRIERVTSRIRAGNLYINRNQIGAIVGSQPFGGQGLSGTGPKAGGPAYVPHFYRPKRGHAESASGPQADPAAVQTLLDRTRAASVPLATESLPGPTGESNRLSTLPRGTVLCLGPGREAAGAQARQARLQGCATVIVAPDASGPGTISGLLSPAALAGLTGVDAVAFWGGGDAARTLRVALASREGPLIPLLTEADLRSRCVLERHVCIDTTAAGGNATLLAAVA